MSGDPRTPTRRPSPGLSWLALSLAAALTAVSAASLVLQRQDDTRMPTRDALGPIADSLNAQLRSGDWVRTLPSWFYRTREVLGHQPYLTGTPLDPLERHLVERIWYVVEDPRQADADRAWTPQIEWSMEGDRVALGVGEVVPGPPVLWDGWAALESGNVSRGERSCSTWIEDGHHCGTYNEFLFVGRAVREMDEQPRRCISANAPDQGEAWTITWSEVPRGAYLRVRAGNTFDAVRALRGSEVTFAVSVDGEVVIDERFDPNAVGYPLFEAAVAPGAPDELVEVSVSIRADDHFDRFFCFRPQMTGAPSI